MIYVIQNKYLKKFNHYSTRQDIFIPYFSGSLVNITEAYVKGKIVLGIPVNWSRVVQTPKTIFASLG